MGRAHRFVQRVEQRVTGKALVELPQVVERHRRLRQRRQRLTRGVIGQVTQHAIAQPFMRHVAQLLFDSLDRSALFFIRQRGQTHWIGAGEPAHSTAQVDVIKQRFAAMPFQLNQRRRLPGPTTQHPCQCAQQQVIDLRAVSTGRLLQELPGSLGVQVHADRLRVLILPATLWPVAGQLDPWPVQLLAPQA